MDFKPGMTRVPVGKKHAKTVYACFGVFASKNEAGRIHIRVTAGDFGISTVTNHRESERYHRTLFRNLRRILIAEGSWPYGTEGEETEKRG